MIGYLESVQQQQVGLKNARSSSVSHISEYASNPTEQTETSKNRVKRKEEAKIGSSKRMASSGVSASNRAQTKSIYESVLEERRNRRTRNSRIV